VHPNHVSPLYARTHNALLDFLRNGRTVDALLPVQAELAERFGASRTTVHRVLRSLKRSGLINETVDGIRLKRRPTQKDFLPQPRLLSRREEVEHSLMEMLVQGRLKPGERFSELALAHQHRVTTGTVREALLRLAGLGVFKKSERKQWVVAKVDAEMINELADIRTLIELYALKRYFRHRSPSSEKFAEIYDATRKLAQARRPDREAFFRLDAELHRAILESGHNRYLADQFRFASFPIQVQFLHNGFDAELQCIGLSQHLAILEAIVRGDEKDALRQLENHLEEARHTLLKFEAADKISGANASK
jgi:GntR family transcriptional regulator, transcriptional activator for L-galactonate catabolism